MRPIFYNSEVANYCGKNGVVKAVLLNYIYYYHKHNTSKKLGDPACISLTEFVYQYRVGDDDGLWKRSFIHEILDELKSDGHLIKIGSKNKPEFVVSFQIAAMLTDSNAKVIRFDLEEAVEHGIHVAVMHRYLLHVIKQSPKGVAYNLSVQRMSEASCISPAQIYRAVTFLEEMEVVKRVKSPVRKYSRALCLARYDSKAGESRQPIVK